MSIQNIPVLPKISFNVVKGEKPDHKRVSFYLRGMEPVHFPTIDKTLSAPTGSAGYMEIDLNEIDRSKIPDDIDFNAIVAGYALEKSGYEEQVAECHNCENLIFNEEGKVAEGTVCPECALAMYFEQERVAMANQPDQAAERLKKAKELAVITGLTEETISEVLLYRPRLEPILYGIKKANVPRKTTVIEQFANGKAIYLSNEPEPLFNIGRWGKPYYNSCQDWKDFTWADMYLRSIHQLEDPDILVMWYGTETEMMSRCLVRQVKDAKTGELMLGMDAHYGSQHYHPGLMANALKAYAKRRKKGESVVWIRGGKGGDSQLYSIVEKPTCVSRTPALFSNETGSYADLGEWRRFVAGPNAGKMVHISPYHRA